MGLPAIIGDRPYSLTAVAHAHAEVSFVTRDVFSRLMLSEPAPAQPSTDAPSPQNCHPEEPALWGEGSAVAVAFAFRSSQIHTVPGVEPWSHRQAPPSHPKLDIKSLFYPFTTIVVLINHTLEVRHSPFPRPISPHELQNGAGQPARFKRHTHRSAHTRSVPLVPIPSSPCQSPNLWKTPLTHSRQSENKFHNFGD
jgi:hypothetical protein